MSENKLEVIESKNITDNVLKRIKAFQSNNELVLPPNYSPENALKSAWLILQDAQDKNYKPVLEVCTKASIANALLRMIVQGLNPDKNQCYFIAYGTKLQLQRSYFGTMAIAKSVDSNIEDIYAQVVYQDDEFEYEIVKGRTVITKHKQKIQNVDKEKIVCAYCSIQYKDGSERSTIMTFAEIKQAWKQSKMNPVDDKGNLNAKSTHDKFTAEMAMKTVTNKACKPIINSSNDSNLMLKMAKESDEEIQEAQLEEELAENANQIDIDIEYEHVPDQSDNTPDTQTNTPDSDDDTGMAINF